MSSHSDPTATETNLNSNRTNAASAGHGTGDHKRLRSMHVLSNTTENAPSDVDAFGKSPDLGLSPMVAELVNEFIDTQGQLVYIVETGEVSDPDNVRFENRATTFPSTIVDVFSTEAAARACIR